MKPILLILTLFTLILISYAPSVPDSSAQSPLPAPQSAGGGLEVTQVIPDPGTTEIGTRPTITVIFNRPVVPLTSLAEAETFPQPVTFEPAVEGTGEWLNTAIYLFTPSVDLAGGTTYTARVAEGLTDAVGEAVLAEEFSWQFTTHPPQVVYAEPSDGQTLVDADTAIRVTFNQPIDPQSAREKFRMTYGFIFTYHVDGEFEVNGSTLTFTPTERLEFDTTYELNMQAGVTGASGGQGSREDYPFHFTTVPYPRLTHTTPDDNTEHIPPGTDFTLWFNTPINPATVMEHVTFEPPLPITSTNVYTYPSSGGTSFHISFGAKPSTSYQVRIEPGIEDTYGNETQESLQVDFQTAPLPPSFRLHTSGLMGTYDADLTAKLILSHVNLNEVDFELYRFEPEEILRPSYEWYDETVVNSGQLIRQWTERLNGERDQQVYHTVDLVEGGGALEPGVYVVRADAPQLRENYAQQEHILVVSHHNLTLKVGERDTLVWANNLETGEPLTGLTVSWYDDKRQWVGEAVTNEAGLAELDLSGREYRANLMAVVLTEGELSAVAEDWSRGISPYDFGLEYVYDLPEFTSHLYTDRPIYRPGQTVYFKGAVRAEDDVNFSIADLGQVRVSIRDAAYETVFDHMLPLSPNGTFNGELTLPDQAPLGSYVLTLDLLFLNYYAEQVFQVAEYCAPEFEVTVTPRDTELLRGQDSELTVELSYFFGGPLSNTNVEWNVLAEDYQFAPRQLGNYKFYDADDPYICLDCWWWQPQTVPSAVVSGFGTTDAEGKLTVQLTGLEIDDLLDKGSDRLIIEATASGPDNQFISGRASLIQHKGDYYIGLSPQEYVANAGQETAVDLVAVDWAINRLAEQNINLAFVRHEWVNSFISNGSGGGYWNYERQTELVETLTVTTDGQGEATVNYTPPQGGVYQIIAADAGRPLDWEDTEAKGVRSSIFVWVAGEGQVSWRRENHNRLTLISDKAEYAPGETAEILIPSPFEGAHQALVTVERGRILAQEVIDIDSSSTLYELPITADHAPNIYVSVVLLQGRDGPTSGDAPRLADYKVGILPLDVRLTREQLQISLTSETEQAEPGTEVTYQIEVSDLLGQPVQTELSFDLVDQAVLNLQPRPAEAIVDAFYQRRGLGINTATTLAVSINRYLLELAEDLDLDAEEMVQTAELRQSRTGGEGDVMGFGLAMDDAMEEALPMPAEAAPLAKSSAPLPPGLEIREEFADTAFWSPRVTTDADGQGELTLTLPDNLTTWVLRGVGLSRDTQVGEGLTDLVSTKPLLIRPVTPRFLVVEDRAELSANISNNTDEDLLTEVTLSAEGVTPDETTPAVQTVTVPARSETKVSWDVVADDVTEAELIFAAVSGSYSDAAKPRLTTGEDGTLRVLRYSTPDIVGTAGQLTEGDTRSEVIDLPDNTDARQGSLSVQVDPSLAAGMQDGLDYLEHFEYECTEQTVSRFLPNLLTYNALQQLGIDNPTLADKLPTLVETGITKLTEQQNPDGGWGWWASPTGGYETWESNVHVTAYTVFALTKAKQAGENVSDTVLANGQNFLLNELGSIDQINDTRRANRHAFVLYALAEGNRAPTDKLSRLFEAREKLDHFGRAYLALALDLSGGERSQIDTLLSDLNNAAILSATGVHWEEQSRDWWSMNTDTRSTAIILDALARLDPENELIPNVVRWLMVVRQDGIWETTQETAWALISLTDWMLVTGELDADYDYTVSLNEAELGATTVSRETVQDGQQFSVPIADLIADASNRLIFARTDGAGRLYYSAHLKLYLPVEDVEAVDRGVVVSRRYTRASCEAENRLDCPEVNTAELGEVLRVDLTLIAPNDLYYVMVEDPLPAGAEAIDTGLDTTSMLAQDPTLSPGPPLFPWWWQWYSRSELRDEKVVLFADHLPRGSYEYSYTIRATLPGDYRVMPTLAQEMYFPEVFGRGDGRLLSVR